MADQARMPTSAPSSKAPPPAPRTESSAPTVRPAELEALEDDSAPAPENVVERLLKEVLSVPPVAPPADMPVWEQLAETSGTCDVHVRRIYELETMVATRDRRIAELEALLAQEGDAEILREELEKTRAHSARLDQCIARLTKERDQVQEVASEVETLRSSADQVAAENVELETALRAAQAEKERLAGELARLHVLLESMMNAR
jgi:hypothetical protein